MYEIWLVSRSGKICFLSPILMLCAWSESQNKWVCSQARFKRVLEILESHVKQVIFLEVPGKSGDNLNNMQDRFCVRILKSTGWTFEDFDGEENNVPDYKTCTFMITKHLILYFFALIYFYYFENKVHLCNKVFFSNKKKMGHWFHFVLNKASHQCPEYFLACRVSSWGFSNSFSPWKQTCEVQNC